MRWLTAVIVIVGALTIINRHAGAAERGPCDEERWLRITPEEVRDNPNLVPGLIRCAAERWNVDLQTSMRVAECESGLWPWAHGNGNYGLFQHRGPYWPGRVDRFLKSEWFNDAQWDRVDDVPQGAYIARANVIVTMRYVNAFGWSAWSCY